MKFKIGNKMIINNKIRVGCTSYVIPDDVLPNIKKTAPIFDDIEIVLFESSDFSNLPSKETVDEIGEILKENDTTCTIHFPIDRNAGSTDPNERAALVKQVFEIIELFEPISPFAYILHLQGIGYKGTSSEADIKNWHQCSGEVCSNIAAGINIDPARIAVESLGYPIEWHEDLVKANGFSYCIDLGHSWLYYENWFDVLQKYIKEARVIHIHGVKEGKDHISLKKGNSIDVNRALSEVRKNFEGVLTLEVFNENDTFESLEIVKEQLGL